MALKIIENNGDFAIKGKITCHNVQAMVLHFEYILKRRNQLTINITDVTEMDSDGLMALTKMYKYTLLSKKLFRIIGEGSKEIYAYFKKQNIA